MSEYDCEPTPGLPGRLPAGERILWQGAPDWRVLANGAFHVRLVTGYFALLAGWACASALAAGPATPDRLSGVAATIVVGAVGVALLHLLAWGSARTTLYTLTNRRLVMRVGIAVPKCINLPLAQIASVDLALRGDGSGDLPLTLIGAPKLGYLALWPHARAWRIVRPVPMLRALPDAATVAALVARTCLAVQPDGRIAAVAPRPDPAPALGEAVAA